MSRTPMRSTSSIFPLLGMQGKSHVLVDDISLTCGCLQPRKLDNLTGYPVSQALLRKKHSQSVATKLARCRSIIIKPETV